jgi:hypothetical protein
MEHWAKYAFMEQDHDRMLQESAKSRLLRKLKDNPKEDSISFKEEQGPGIMRKLLYAAWIVVLIALWFVSIALSASHKN